MPGIAQGLDVDWVGRVGLADGGLADDLEIVRRVELLYKQTKFIKTAGSELGTDLTH